MTNHERYRKAFSALEKPVNAAALAAKIETEKPDRIAPKVMRPAVWLVACIVGMLFLTVIAAAAGVGWLSSIFGESASDKYLRDRTRQLEEAITKDGLTWQMDQAIVEGRFLMFSITSEPSDDNPKTPPEYPTLSLELHTEEGIVYYCSPDVLYASSTHVEQNPARVRNIYCLSVGGVGSAQELVGKFFRLKIWDEEVDDIFPVLQIDLPIDSNPTRAARLEDGTGVRIGAISVELQGYEFFGQNSQKPDIYVEDIPCGVVLQDGIRVPFSYLEAIWLRMTPSEDYWNAGLLTEVIDPAAVTAIYRGDTEYALEDLP